MKKVYSLFICVIFLTISQAFAGVPQTITFPDFQTLAVGAPDFEPAISSSGFQVSYESSNTSVAIIVNGKIRILANGNTIITASVPGDGTYDAAPSITKTLTVATGGNLVPNSTFEVGIDGYSGNENYWYSNPEQLFVTLGTQNGSNAMKLSVPSSANVAADTWKAQVGICPTMDPTKYYKASFTASCESGTRIFDFNSWTLVGNLRVCTNGWGLKLTTTPTVFNITLNSPTQDWYNGNFTSAQKIKVRFYVGGTNIPMYIDDFKLWEYDPNASGVNDFQADNITVFSQIGGLRIKSANYKAYRIINTLGQVIAKGIVEGDNQFIPLKAKGIVVVQIDKKATKVMLAD